MFDFSKVNRPLNAMAEGLNVAKPKREGLRAKFKRWFLESQIDALAMRITAGGHRLDDLIQEKEQCINDMRVVRLEVIDLLDKHGAVPALLRLSRASQAVLDNLEQRL